MLTVASFPLFLLHGETSRAMTWVLPFLQGPAAAFCFLGKMGMAAQSVPQVFWHLAIFTSKEGGGAFIMSNVWLCKGCQCRISLLCLRFALSALSWDRL